jgi:Ca-activated chloride channel homolog
MQSTSPARFAASFPTDAQGSYLVTVEARGKSRTELGETGLAVAYSAEHRSIGADMPFLQAVASAGGGSIVERPKQMWADNLTAVYDQRSLSNYLWLVALFLLPVDIAVRRLFFGR